MFIPYAVYRNLFISFLERERKKHFDFIFSFQFSVVLERATPMALELEDLYWGIDSGKG